MSRLYSKGAGDPEWPITGHSRDKGAQYVIVQEESTMEGSASEEALTVSKLEVGGSTSGGVYTLEQNKETIIHVVETLNAIRARRQRQALSSYEDGLCRYLTAIMRKVASFYKSKSWRLVGLTLEAYELREMNGFKHDVAGRDEWSKWKEASSAAVTGANAAVAESPSNVPSTTGPTEMSPIWRDSQDGEGIATPQTEEEQVRDWEERLPTPSEEQDALNDLPFDSPPPADESPRKILTQGLERLQLDVGLDSLPQTGSTPRAIRKLPTWAKPTAATSVLGSNRNSPALPGKQPAENALGLELRAGSTPAEPNQDVQQSAETEPAVLNIPLGPSKKRPRRVGEPLPQLPSKEATAPIPSGSSKGKTNTAAPTPQPLKASKAHSHMLSISKDGPPSKPKGTKKHVAMLSLSKNGLLVKEDVRPAKRPRVEGTQASQGAQALHVAQKLWDLLSTLKNISEGSQKMPDNEVLNMTRDVLDLIRKNGTPKLQKIMKQLAGWDKYYLPVKGLSRSESKAWEDLKSLHVKTNSMKP
ncbi:hypothetical protein FRC05_007139 [Tulasnella sp. 425]|nr:hypothetical protein FRC05_007139 [Tulasnella sp. 425]